MSRGTRAFWLAFTLLALAKALLAARLPLFGDEAWYWLEGRHLAWAYSDLPGLTAWLIRFGTWVAGDTEFGVRWPFLLMSMAVPLLVRAMATTWFGEGLGLRAAWLALLMPLLGALGFLALPDVPMTLAAAMCLLASARLLDVPAQAGTQARSSMSSRAPRRSREGGNPAPSDEAPTSSHSSARDESLRNAALLAAGLTLGALSHYRFALIILAGFIGLLLDPRGRRALRRPTLWIAIAIGALAWLPLIAWNLAHHGAGLEFQLADRHPWSLHAGGFWFLPTQLAIASPLLALAGAIALLHAWRARGDTTQRVPWGLVLGTAGVPLLLYGVLAFVADRERVSFHWTLQAWLPLLCVAPMVIARWSRSARTATYAVAGAGLIAVLAFSALAAVPAWRARFADSRAYPDNFAGWHEIAAATRDLAPLAADNFMLGAQLAFARGEDTLPILDHPLNRKHGRAVQLASWGQGAASTTARWLVLEDTAVPLRARLSHYHAWCDRLDDLPIERVLNVDHGRKRFLVLDLARRTATCRTPALAWIDAPAIGASVSRTFEVSGWAFKDGAGIARVDITLDGVVVAQGVYGEARPHVAVYWRDSRDPAHPRVGFSAKIDATAIAAGEHWLGLVLHGKDGSVEGWPEQRIELH